MVYYGPWQDPLVFVEEIRPTTSGQTASAAGEILPHPAVATSVHRPSGFSFVLDGQDEVTGSSLAAVAAYGRVEECARVHAYEGTGGDANMWDIELGVCKIGSSGQTGPGGDGVVSVTHSARWAYRSMIDREEFTDVWTATAKAYRFAFSAVRSIAWGSPYSHAPDGVDWPDGAVDVEAESSDVTLERVWVPGWQGLNEDDLFRARIKEPGDSGGAWLNLSPTDWASLADLHGYPEIPHGAGEYDVTGPGIEWLQGSWNAGRAGSPFGINLPEQPRIGFGWNGNKPDPDAFANEENPAADVTAGLLDLRVAVMLRYRGSRWRYVYSTPPEPDAAPSFRRTFPRDDSLGGGAARTWPSSKAVQSSNRTAGGYL